MILKVLLNTQIIWMIFAENHWEFESKLSRVRIGANESSKQLSEIENISEFYKSWEKLLNFIMLQKAAYDWKMEKDSKYQLLNKCFKDFQYHLHK